MTLAITKLLQLGDSELVGVFAQLGYINESRLSAVLAANYASSLQVCRSGEQFMARSVNRSCCGISNVYELPSLCPVLLFAKIDTNGPAMLL